jgi:fumarate reductase subunit D
MDKQKEIDYIRKLKKLSDEDNYVLRRRRFIRSDMFFMIVLLFAVLYYPLTVAINVINSGIHFSIFNIAMSAYIVFGITAIEYGLKLLLIVLTFVVVEYLINKKEHKKAKEIKEKLRNMK